MENVIRLEELSFGVFSLSRVGVDNKVSKYFLEIMTCKAIVCPVSYPQRNKIEFAILEVINDNGFSMVLQKFMSV